MIGVLEVKWAVEDFNNAMDVIRHDDKFVKRDIGSSSWKRLKYTRSGIADLRIAHNTLPDFAETAGEVLYTNGNEISVG